MNPTRLPAPFDETNRKFTALQTALQAGQINDIIFRDEVRKLVVIDHQGVSWWPGYDGRWYRHDGRQWVASDPPAAVPTPTQAEPAKPRQLWPWVLIPGFFLFACLSLVMIVFLLRFNGGDARDQAAAQPTRAAVVDEQIPAAQPESTGPTPEPTPHTIAEVSISPDQQFLLDDFGSPDAFTLLEIEKAGGGTLRYETWTYYEGSASFTFSDGVFQLDGVVEPLPQGFIAAPYLPDQFPLGASPQAVQEQLDGAPLTVVDGSENFQPGLQLYAGRQLLLGFTQNRLVYVEALAFIPEGSEP